MSKVKVTFSSKYDEQIILLGDDMAGILRRDLDRKTMVTHRTERHIFRKYDGFGISESVLTELLFRGFKRVRVVFSRQNGSQSVWEVSLLKWADSDKVWVYKGDKQLFMSFQDLDKHNYLTNP